MPGASNLKYPVLKGIGIRRQFNDNDIDMVWV